MDLKLIDPRSVYGDRYGYKSPVGGRVPRRCG